MEALKTKKRREQENALAIFCSRSVGRNTLWRNLHWITLRFVLCVQRIVLRINGPRFLGFKLLTKMVWKPMIHLHMLREDPDLKYPKLRFQTLLHNFLHISVIFRINGILICPHKCLCKIVLLNMLNPNLGSKVGGDKFIQTTYPNQFQRLLTPIIIHTLDSYISTITWVLHPLLLCHQFHLSYNFHLIRTLHDQPNFLHNLSQTLITEWLSILTMLSLIFFLLILLYMYHYEKFNIGLENFWMKMAPLWLLKKKKRRKVLVLHLLRAIWRM